MKKENTPRPEVLTNKVSLPLSIHPEPPPVLHTQVCYQIAAYAKLTSN